MLQSLHTTTPDSHQQTLDTAAKADTAMPAPGEIVPSLSVSVKANAEAIWCLRELEKRDAANQVRKDILAPIQNAAIHYACSSVKQQAGNLPAVVKANRVINAYKSVAAKGMMEWMMEEAERPLPSWLTPQLMGHSTVKGADEPKLYMSGSALWGRYRKSAGAIRKDFNVIWDEFMASDASPPRLGVAAAMENLQQKLYMLDQKRKLRAGYTPLYKDAAETVAEDEKHGDNAEGVGAPEGAGGKRAAIEDEARTKSKGSGNKEKAGGADEKEGAGLWGEPGTGAAEDGRVPPVIIEGPAGDGDGEERRPKGGGGGHPELDRNDARVFGDRPEGWLHPASLVFAMYGRPSDKEDEELKMEACSGPLDRKRKAQQTPSGGKDDADVDVSSSSDMDVGGSSVYPKALGITGGGEKPRSRAKTRKDNARRRVASESLALQREALEHLKNPVESEQQATLPAALETITQVFVRKEAFDIEAMGYAREAEARAQRAEDRAQRAEARAESKQKSEALYTRLNVLKQRGDEEEAERVAKTLLNHLDTIITIPTDPPTPSYFREHAAALVSSVLSVCSKEGGGPADDGGGSGGGPCVGKID